MRGGIGGRGGDRGVALSRELMLPSFKDDDELDQDAIECALRLSVSRPTAAGVGR